MLLYFGLLGMVPYPSFLPRGQMKNKDKAKAWIGKALDTEGSFFSLSRLFSFYLSFLPSLFLGSWDSVSSVSTHDLIF